MTAFLHKNRSIGFFSLIFGTLTLCLTQVSAQTFDISGTVSSSSNPIRSAWLTFVNNADTTQRFYALADTLGHYQVNVVLSSINNCAVLRSDPRRR